MDSFDVERFRANGSGKKLPARNLTKSSGSKWGGWFVKGPIPGEWIGRAAKLPGKSLHAALALCHEVGLTKQRRVKLTRRLLGKFGVGPDAARRSLNRLEEEGLVTVDRKVGRCPMVQLPDFDKRG